MSVGENQVGQTGGPDVMLARALAKVVRELGRGVVSDPRRVQGTVNDVLGAHSGAHRTEIDAVVLAADESIPEDLLAERIDLDTAMARLQHRGLDENSARFAFEVWRYALGMLADDAQPPSITDSVPLTTRLVVSDRAPDPLPAFAPPQVDGVVQITPQYWQAPPPAGPPLGGPRQNDRRRTAVLIAVPLLVVATLLTVIAVTRGGDNEQTLSTATTVPPATTTATATTEAATTTTQLAVVETAFTEETTPFGQLARTWAIEGTDLVGKLVVTNSTAADTTGRHYEVVPKSLAATADLIVSEPAHIVIENDPVIAWDLVVPAGGTTEISYRIAVGDAVTTEQLDLWITDQTTAKAAFDIERTTPPTLIVTTPNDIVIPGEEGTITGTADPTSVVAVNGVAVAVNPDGTWAHPIAGLAIGPNSFTITATNQFGTVASVPLNIIVELPVVSPPTATTVRPTSPGPTTTVRPPTPQPPPPADPGITTTTLALPPTPPPSPPDLPPDVPPPPANRPPTKKFDPTFTAMNPCQFSVDDWTVYVLQAFTDPDGDAMHVSAVSAVTGTASPSSQGIHWFEPYADFVGQAIVGFVVDDGRGGSGSAALTITVPPGSQTC